MSMENITTIGSLLREVWRYEPEILKLIFEFLFIPVYEDKEKKYRYIEALPEPGTTCIKKDAFSGCSSLQSVTIGNSVTNIGYAAFFSCSSLKSVTIPNSVTNIGGVAFQCCPSLQSVTIPNSVTTIGGGAFSLCKKLNQVSIPDHLEKRVKRIPLVFPKKTKIIVR